MRTVGVVPGSIPLREHLRLQHRRKELAVKQFIAEGCIERFNIPVLPRRARLDVARVDVAIAQVILQRLGKNSGPLSLRRFAGGPCSAKSPSSACPTRREVIERETSIMRHSLVYSSMIGMNLTCRPASVVSNRKSTLQT